jgi:hypothetical protein
VILTYPPGGASDIMGRIIAQKLGEISGQSVLVENRAGANGAIGIEYAARQPADGTSFVIGNLAPVAINPLISKVSYNMTRDFQPVSLVASAPTILVTHVSIPAKTLLEFVKLARSRPGEVNWGTAGPGTLGHLGGEMLKRLAKIDMLHVPYKGGVLAIQDLPRWQRASRVRRPAADHSPHTRGQGAAAGHYQRQALGGRSRYSDIRRGRRARLRRGELVGGIRAGRYAEGAGGPPARRPRQGHGQCRPARAVRGDERPADGHDA